MAHIAPGELTLYGSSQQCRSGGLVNGERSQSLVLYGNPV